METLSPRHHLCVPSVWGRRSGGRRLKDGKARAPAFVPVAWLLWRLSACPASSTSGGEGEPCPKPLQESLE